MPPPITKENLRNLNKDIMPVAASPKLIQNRNFQNIVGLLNL